MTEEHTSELQSHDNLVCLEFRRVLFRSEEHTSELQSHDNLVCRLLLEKKYSRPPGPSPGRRCRPPSPTPPPSPRARAAPGRGWRRASLRCARVARPSPRSFFLNDAAPPGSSTFSLPAPFRT